MGYIIDYSIAAPSVNRIAETRSVRKKKRYLILLLMIIICIFAFSVKATGFDIYQLLPGNKDVTRAALTSFLNNISNGISFQDAITAFCTEILNGAQLG